MLRNKYIILGILTAVLVSAAVGGFWYTKSANKKQAPENEPSSFTLGSSYDPSSVSLSSLQKDDSSSGLRVDQQPRGTGLGQLETADKQQGAPAESGSRRQASPFDPATFKQYDKYQDANAGLFAEVQMGTGAELINGKKAAVYYKGWLTDGQLFDQSKMDEKGVLQPFVFQMGAGQVIPGWEQALSGMKVGGVRLVIVPPSAGYGPTGQGPIPGNAVLIFQVQLAAVE